jgi:hypothetical protein
MGPDVADAAFDPKGSLKRALGVDGLTVDGLTADPAEPKPSASDRRYDPDAT